MSIESTEAKSPGPTGDPYAGSEKKLPPDPNHSPPSTNGDSSSNGDSTAHGDAARAPGLGASGGDYAGATLHGSGEVPGNPDLPVKPLRNLPRWLIYNLVIPVILLCAAAGIVWMLGTVESAARPPIDDTPVGRLFALPAVDVVPVRSLASTGEKLHLSADGTVVPFREVILATEVAGQIVEKSPLCETGKYVTKGAVLMRIDPTDYELEVKRLQRQRQQEYEALGEVDQEMVNTKRSMELARADIELQRRELKRQEALPSQFASQGELDQARRALLSAQQQLVVYQNQLDLSEKKRTRLESAERLAAMQLEAAENNLRRTEIKAPISGVVVSEQAELNTFVARGSPVVTIEDTSKVEVAAKLRTDQLYWVLNQRKADVANDTDAALTAPLNTQDRGYRLPPTPVIVRYVVSGRDGLIYQWTGNLIGYDGIGLDEQTRTVPVRILVDDPQTFQVIRDGKVTKKMNASDEIAGPTALVRGMFVKLRLELDPAVELVVLPSEALKPGNRVWQFLPDASVLDVSITPEGDEAEGGDADRGDADEPEPSAAPEQATEQIADASKSDDASPEESEGGKDEPAGRSETDPMAGFDPAAWVPGNLVIRQNIRPIDLFVTEEEFIANVPGDDLDSEVQATGQSWICEVSGDVLVDGSFVVVSPVGNLRTDVFPVRAPASVVGEVTTAATEEIAGLRLAGPEGVSPNRKSTRVQSRKVAVNGERQRKSDSAESEVNR